MDRKAFLHSCSRMALLAAGLPMLLPGCAGTKQIEAKRSGKILSLSLDAFKKDQSDGSFKTQMVIVRHMSLKYPIAVYHLKNSEFFAMEMKCTHQQAELQVFGDRLQCPAHGSEFSATGEVLLGPASYSLTRFPVTLNNDELNITLS